MEKSVFPVGNQMEKAFPLEIFRKKGNTFRGIPLFLVFTGIIEKSLYHLLYQTSAMLLGKNTRFPSRKMASTSFMFHCPTCGFECINMDAFISHSCATSGEY